jgi:hypothetical protein
MAHYFSEISNKKIMIDSDKSLATILINKTIKVQ